MKSERPGRGTSAVEVTQISERGLWLLLDQEELFLPFASFPWFREATIRQVQNVKRVRPDHLRWPDLDIDVSLDSIRHPEKYPLVSTPDARTAAPRSGRRPARSGRVSDQPKPRRRTTGR